MEGKTGFDVAEYLRDVAHVPFMFLSAFADADTRAKVEALGAMAYLVKPLDVGQIVPTVDQVFARLRGGAAQPVPPVLPVVVTPVLPLVAPAVQPAAPADDLVPLALGILMQRFSLTRTQAAERLARLAGDKGLSPAAQAARLVESVEDLAGPTA